MGSLQVPGRNRAVIGVSQTEPVIACMSMRSFGWGLCAGVGLLAFDALAGDAGRGARLYLGLPGGQASCVECHGPDPGLNRNRLLNAAQGPQAIRRAIGHASAMGYLGELLDESALSDLSAWLRQVDAAAQGEAPATVWPWGLEFGKVVPGALPGPHPVVLHNSGPNGLWLAPRLRATQPGGEAGLQLGHDCPQLLPPGSRCTAWVGVSSLLSARVHAALDWGDSAVRAVGISASVDAQAAGLARWRDERIEPWVLQVPNGQSAVFERMVVNAGSAPLSLGVPAITGPGAAAFRLEAGGCSAGQVIEPGTSCAVRLRADAAAGTAAEALLQWRNDGSHLPPARLELRPVGLAPAPSAPSPPPAAPLVTTQPIPTPAPPAATPVADATGGGCSTALPPSPPDATLPGLVALALLAHLARSRRRVTGKKKAGLPGYGSSPVPTPTAT